MAAYHGKRSPTEADPWSSRRHHRYRHHHHHRHHSEDSALSAFWRNEFEDVFAAEDPLPAPWKATLFSPEPDAEGRPSVDPVCALVLASFNEQNWNGRCRATQQEQSMWFDLFDTDNDGCLKLEEVWSKVDANQQLIREKMPGSLHGLLIHELVKGAFSSSAFDQDMSGDLDPKEWDRFLDEMERRYLRYRRQLSFQSQRAFYGRGWTEVYEDSESEESGNEGDEGGSSSSSNGRDEAERELGLLRKIAGACPHAHTPKMQWGLDRDRGQNLLPPGWWDDFYYYSANYHPLHGIISCDPDHQLSQFERVWMEIATFGFLFLAANWKADIRKEDDGAHLNDGFALRFFLNAAIALAGTLVYYVLYQLFTCPKLGFVDLSRAKTSEVQFARRCELTGSVIGYLLMSFLLVALLIDIPMMQKRWRPVLFHRVQGYIWTWLFMLFLPFNPFFAWGNNSNDHQVHIGDYLGFGQWRIEKQRFQQQCHRLKDITLEDVTGSQHDVSSLMKSFSGTGLPSPRDDLAATLRVHRPRQMESGRGIPQMRLERAGAGRRRSSQAAPASEHPKARERSSLSFALWGEVFSSADTAWREYMSGRALYRDRKP